MVLMMKKKKKSVLQGLESRFASFYRIRP